MEFLLLFKSPAGTPPEVGGMAEMKRFAAELASQGKLRRGAPLGPEADGAFACATGGRS